MTAPFDDLAIPQPPYRMKRPEAVLAASEDTIPPVVEQAPQMPENVSLAQLIEEEEAAVQAVAQEEKEKMVKTIPPVGATPEEASELDTRHQEADKAIDAVVADWNVAFQQETRAEEEARSREKTLAALRELTGGEKTAEPAKEVEVGSERVSMPPTPDIERARAEAEQAAATPPTPPEPRPVPAAPEAGPSEREQQLQQELEQLRAQVAELQHRIESGSGQPPPSPEPAPEPEPEPAPEEPERISDIGEQREIGFWENWKTGFRAKWEDFNARRATILAQGAKVKLEKRNEKIKDLEERARELSKKGALGTQLSFLWHERWINRHKRKGFALYRTMAEYNDGRIAHENARDEILNQGAARIDRFLDSALERADQYALEASALEERLEELHQWHKKLTRALSLTSDPEKQRRIKDKLDENERTMRETSREKADLDAKAYQERRRVKKQQTRKEALLVRGVRPSRVDTTPPSYSWIDQRIKRATPGMGPRAGAQRIAEKREARRAEVEEAAA